DVDIAREVQTPELFDLSAVGRERVVGIKADYASFTVEDEFICKYVLRFDSELCYDRLNEFLEAAGDDIDAVRVLLKELLVSFERLAYTVPEFMAQQCQVLPGSSKQVKTSRQGFADGNRSVHSLICDFDDLLCTFFLFRMDIHCHFSQYINGLNFGK